MRGIRLFYVSLDSISLSLDAGAAATLKAGLEDPCPA